MGARHAHHFHALTVIAVSSPKQEELDWAKENVEGAQTYLDSDELLEEESSLQAVVIASATSVHAEQAIKVIKRGLHVLCEKPLSISVEKV
jgi:myo-inositol 2-dehydrogenase/D-chiro-inositol 1-dehydrogenase